jgi:hypothetical protein
MYSYDHLGLVELGSEPSIEAHYREELAAARTGRKPRRVRGVSRRAAELLLARQIVAAAGFVRPA